MNNYVLKKYKKFYKEHRYIPPLFNPYNCYEIGDIAPTITSQCGSTTTTATILIKESKELHNGNKKEYGSNDSHY